MDKLKLTQICQTCKGKGWIKGYLGSYPCIYCCGQGSNGGRRKKSN